MEKLGTTPESLRDLSVSLNNVGDVARERGGRDEALAALSESVSILLQVTRSTQAVAEPAVELVDALERLAEVDRSAPAVFVEDARACLMALPDGEQKKQVLERLAELGLYPAPETGS